MTKIVFALIFVFIFSVLFSYTVLADSIIVPSKDTYADAGGFSLTPTVGGISYNGNNSRSISPIYGVKLGYDIYNKSLTQSLGIEGTLNYFTTQANGNGTRQSRYLFRLDAAYPFIFSKKFIPFISAGGGGIIGSTDSSTQTNLLLNYGAGIKYFLTDFLACRVDVRHVLVYTNENTQNNFELAFGLSYYFGKGKNGEKSLSPDERMKEHEQNEQKANEQREKELKRIEQEQELQEQKENERINIELQKQDEIRKERLKKEWEEFKSKQNEVSNPNAGLSVSTMHEPAPSSPSIQASPYPAGEALSVPAKPSTTVITKTIESKEPGIKRIVPEVSAPVIVKVQNTPSIPLKSEDIIVLPPPSPIAPVVSSTAQDVEPPIAGKASLRTKTDVMQTPISDSVHNSSASSSSLPIQVNPPIPVEAAPVQAKPALPGVNGEAGTKSSAVKTSVPVISAPSIITQSTQLAVVGASASLTPSASKNGSDENKDFYTLKVGESINRKKLDSVRKKLKEAGQQQTVLQEDRDTDIYRLVTECYKSRDAAIKEKSEISRVSKDAFVAHDNDSYCVVAGSFLTEDDALRGQKQLDSKGQSAKVVMYRETLPIWRINSGMYADRQKAEEAASSLADKGIKTTVERAGHSMDDSQNQKSIKELTIEFDFDKYLIKPKYYQQVKDIADVLKSHPTSSALIEGHTDIIGSELYNLGLSDQRALSVKNLLIKCGIDRKRITVKGYGPAKPISDNNTIEGRQKNRRAITLVIVNN